jgi:hypothetical protein
MAFKLGACFTNRYDFYLNVWDLWWVAKAVTHSGISLYETEFLFHPHGTHLAVQPLTLVQTVSAIPLTLSLGPVMAYNIMVWFSFWFAGWITALFCRAVSGSAFAGLVGGTLFTFCPYHYTFLPQLNLVAIGFLPLYLYALLFFRRKPTIGGAALAGAALAASGYASWYYGIMAGMIAVVCSIERLVRGGDLALRKRALLEAMHWGTTALLLAPAFLAMLPAFSTDVQHPEAIEHGEPLQNYLVMQLKGTMDFIGMWSYLGMGTLVLAFAGIFPLRRRVGYLLMTLFFAILFMGDKVALGSFEITLPFYYFRNLPVLIGLRYSDRCMVMVQLGLAVLACFGAARLQRGITARWPRKGSVAMAAVLVLLLLEFWPGPLLAVTEVPRVPVPTETQGKPGALLHLPLTLVNKDGESMFHQVFHGRPICGGYLTRRNSELMEKIQEDPLLGRFVTFGGHPPQFSIEERLPLPDAEKLEQGGIAYVCVQRRQTVEVPQTPKVSIFGPFSMGGGDYLYHRYFPDSIKGMSARKYASEWEASIAACLGAAIAENELAAVFEVKGSGE